jgi:hypothetical protein
MHWPAAGKRAAYLKLAPKTLIIGKMLPAAAGPPPPEISP